MQFQKQLRWTVICAFGLVGIALAQGGKPVSGVVVTSGLADFGDPRDGTNRRLQSDGLGTYTNGGSKGDKVESIIQNIGDWVLDTSGSVSRAVLLDFREPVSGSSTSNAPFDWQLVHARLISKCSLTHSGGYPTIPDETTVNCPLHAAFSYGGASYRLTMNPANDGATSYVRVSCKDGVADGVCKRWIVEPVVQADGSTRSIAVLLRDSSSKGKTTTTNAGYFYMTFEIEITNP